MHKRILVVDDDTEVCKVYVDALTDHQVETYNDPFQALGAILGKGEECDLIILDLIMPGLDGATFTRILRAVEEQTGGRRKVVLSTGWHPDKVGHERILGNVDCDDFLPKPVTLNALKQLISKHCK